MRDSIPNWDLRLIPVSGPYSRVRARGCPAHTGGRFALLHPQMERGRRAKIGDFVQVRLESVRGFDFDGEVL